MKSKITASLLCLCLFFSSALSASAAEFGVMWEKTEKASVTLSISGGAADVRGTIIGKAGTTRVHATFTLEKRNSNGTYSPVVIWNESAVSDALYFSDSADVGRGTYRLSVTAQVYMGSSFETVTASTVKTW